MAITYTSKYLQNIFDSLLTLSGDVMLFLRNVQNSHINNCSAAKAEADLYTLIYEFIQRFQQSKVMIFSLYLENIYSLLLNTDTGISYRNHWINTYWVQMELFRCPRNL